MALGIYMSFFSPVMHFLACQTFKWVKRIKVQICILISVRCDFRVCPCKAGTAGG